MKKMYEKPFMEKVEFDYTNQVFASASGQQTTDSGVSGCETPHLTNENTGVCDWK